MFQNVSKRSITGVEISKKSVSILDNYDTLMDKTTIQKLCKEAISPDLDQLIQYYLCTNFRNDRVFRIVDDPIFSVTDHGSSSILGIWCRRRGLDTVERLLWEQFRRA